MLGRVPALRPFLSRLALAMHHVCPALQFKLLLLLLLLFYSHASFPLFPLLLLLHQLKLHRRSAGGLRG